MNTKEQAIEFAKSRKELTDKLTDLIDALACAENNVIWQESLIIDEIATATDEVGKPLYSSEDKRKNALTKLRTMNKDLFDAHFNVRKIKQDIGKTEAEIRLAADMVRILTAFAESEKQVQ